MISWFNGDCGEWKSISPVPLAGGEDARSESEAQDVVFVSQKWPAMTWARWGASGGGARYYI